MYYEYQYLEYFVNFLKLFFYRHTHTHTHTYTYTYSIMVRVFASGPGDLGFIKGQVITKTQKMVLDAFLVYTVIR